MADKPIPVEIADVTVDRPMETREVNPPPPVAVVPFWSYWVTPLGLALLAMIQVLGVKCMDERLVKTQHEINKGQAVIHGEVKQTKEALQEVHEQINSNLEKQFAEFREAILAKERLKRSAEKRGER